MAIRDRYQVFDIGEFTIRLRMPADLDQFDDTDGHARAAGISSQAFPLFGIVWASSELLAHLMLARDIEGLRILELGCGMGLASHVLNARGADITAMDIHPVTEDYMTGNAALNDLPHIPFVVDSWSDSHVDLGKFDLIIAADILYEPRHILHLPGFLERHLTESGEIVIADPARGQSDEMLDAMRQKGFEVNEELPTFTDHLGLPYNGRVFSLNRRPV